MGYTEDDYWDLDGYIQYVAVCRCDAKDSQSVPLFKKDSCDKQDNYRPVTLMSVV